MGGIAGTSRRGGAKIRAPGARSLDETHAGFLIIFAAVNLAEAHTARRRGSTPWISVAAAMACVAALAALIAKSSLLSIGVLVAMVALSFGIEATFRKISGRPIHG